MPHTIHFKFEYINEVFEKEIKTEKYRGKWENLSHPLLTTAVLDFFLQLETFKQIYSTANVKKIQVYW